MLSMIYFSLIIFTMISKTIQLFDVIDEFLDAIDPELFPLTIRKSCFNLTASNGNEQNKCATEDRPDPRDISGRQIRCMECNIGYYTGLVIDNDCSASSECVTFIFNDSVIFEGFFKRYHRDIPKLFPRRLVILPNPIIEIIVKNYNITEITNQYVNSILNMNAPGISIFIRFVNHTQGLQPLVVRNESFPIKFNFLMISVPCNDSNKTITYQVYRQALKSDQLSIQDNCDEFQTTQQVSPHKY